ncbi:MAG: hypothetical protein ACRBFS_05485 [Aureispira sp.]
MIFLRIVLLFGWLLLGTVGYSQNEYRFQPIAQIEQTAQWMEVDKMQQLYLLVGDNDLQKYDVKGNLLCRFNENNLGPISYVDVSNPFRILVYYDDYTTVIFLDRTLSEIQRHDLSHLDLPQVEALGTASDNNLWLFDNNSYTLKKLDQKNEVLVESLDLNLLLPEALNPVRLLEANNRVYLNSPNLGVLVFDLFGNYIKTIPLLDLDYFQWYEGQIFYTQDKKLQAYHLLSFQYKNIELPILEDNLEQLCLAQDRLYAKYPTKIEIIQVREK